MSLAVVRGLWERREATVGDVPSLGAVAVRWGNGKAVGHRWGQ
jgi:hypothetical protein